MSAALGRRRAGLLIPLFSCTSGASWGIGDIADVEPATAWLASAGMRVLQLLPLNEMAPGQQSPYSAISAMAIDPIFIHLPWVPEFEALGGESGLPPSDCSTLAEVRAAPRIAYPQIRRLKLAHLRAAFGRFLDEEWRRDTDRGRALRAYASEQAWWIEDYSLFRALHAREQERLWTEWSVELQRREPAAIDRARRELADEVLFHQYLQWTAGTQWMDARARARQRRAAVRRSPVHGRRRQRRRVGAAAPVPARRLGRRAARRIQRDRAGLGHAALQLGGDGARALPLAARAVAPQRRSVRRLPRRSSRRLLPYVRKDEARRRRLLHPRRRAVAARAGRAAHGFVSQRGRGNHRRGSRHRARLGARVARSARRARLSCVPLGAALAHRRPAVPRPARVSEGVGRDVGDARHRAVGRLVGTRAGGRAAEAGRARARAAACERRRRAHRAVRRRRPRHAARSALRVGIRSAAAADSGRLRLARSHQRAGHGRLSQLDLQASVAGRSHGRARRGARAQGAAPGLGSALRTRVAVYVVSGGEIAFDLHHL